MGTRWSSPLGAAGDVINQASDALQAFSADFFADPAYASLSPGLRSRLVCTVPPCRAANGGGGLR